MKENEDKKELNEKDKELARSTWDSWLNELEDKEQPDQCSIDNPDCEACGS
jgi:hypothetical protein